MTMNKSRVVIINCRRILPDPVRPDPEIILAMLKKGLSLLAGVSSAGEALSHWFRHGEAIGIKINTIAGKALSTAPEVSRTLGLWLGSTITSEEKIIIWDRSDEELRQAGYRISTSGGSLKIFGTDNRRAGYQNQPVSHRHIGSLFSRIQAELIEASISLAILKDHGLAGITAGLKNYFGAIHNPNKYHDSGCDPYVAELFETEAIRNKHRLTILDAIRVQYHRGPSYHPQWLAVCQKLIFSSDPVAADTVGWQLIEELRARKGLPSLQEENREPLYLRTAEKLGLGKSSMQDIEVIEEEI